jgi:hypothetical protein
MFKITGLEEFQRKIDQLRRNAEQMDGTHEVPLSELFSPAFMRQHSSVPNFETFCRDGGIDTSSKEAFEATDVQQLNSAVARLTEFPGWEEMKKAGAADWARRRLFDGLAR